DVGDAGRAVGMARESQALRLEHPGERVVGGIETRGDAPVLLRRVARSGLAAGTRLVRMLRVREEEVDRVLGAVEERPAVGLRGSALERIAALSEDVGLALALRIEGHHHI